MKRKYRKRSVEDSVSKPVSSRRRRLFVTTMIVTAVIALSWFVATNSSSWLLTRAQTAVEHQEFDKAERLSKLVLRLEPTSVKAIFLAGVAAKELRGPDASIEYFERIPDDGSLEAAQAMYARAEFAFQKGWAAEAEALFVRVVAIDPRNLKARERLLYIYAAQGRMWEVSHQVLPLLKSGQVDLNYLIASSTSNRLMEADLPFSKQCLAARPNDPLPRLIEAKWAIHDKKMLEARDLLSEIVQQYPHVLDAQAGFGQMLLETATLEDTLNWHNQLPPNADEHPAIWFVRGLWCNAQNQPDSAIRCFGEAVRRDPNHAAANYQLSVLLDTIGETETANKFAERARRLARLAHLIDELENLDKILETVTLLRDLGRIWEAAGWCRLALGENAVWAKPTLDRLLYELSGEDTLTKRSAHPVSNIDLSSYPLPDYAMLNSSVVRTPSASDTAAVIRFKDVAPEVGLEFTYDRGTFGNDESLFELDGGGVAIADYDLDGWPDAYLTQGGPIPQRIGRPRHDDDGFFKNLDGKKYVDVSEVSGLFNNLYSQGATVGDFDADGFPDLYVSNIGPNVLYRNNGDGTFTDVSEVSQAQGNVWTSSCLMADMNGDALPDIYSVNYIGGDLLYLPEQAEDPDRFGAPGEHPALQDRLYLNLGDGHFADTTEQSGIVAPDGRGLGIVAADFDDSGRLSIFVANDMSANYFFQNKTEVAGDCPKFVERGILSGLAFSEGGAGQACMGVAAGDANQDGRPDLFVTNFYRDSNTFYMQQDDYSFRDEIAASQIQQPSFAQLGWGAQFVDADLDGFSDLLVTNGHVQNRTRLDATIPYQMPPQCFRNIGDGRFTEIDASQLGAYFESKHLGRAMARLDWNRDGREDVCIGHLDAPVALVENTTTGHGNWISLTLVGVQCSRDAIGTKVDVVCGNTTHKNQLYAGDGFHCSNERRLVFGLGTETTVEQIRINWPSGSTDTFSDIMANQELIVIEGGINPKARPR